MKLLRAGSTPAWSPQTHMVTSKAMAWRGRRGRCLPHERVRMWSGGGDETFTHLVLVVKEQVDCPALGARTTGLMERLGWGLGGWPSSCMVT